MRSRGRVKSQRNAMRTFVRDLKNVGQEVKRRKSLSYP